MAEYIVEPKSRADIRKLTRELREAFGFDAQLYFPIVELLDMFCRAFPGFSYEVVEDNDLPETVHADTDIRTGHIRIKQTVFDRACDGFGRDRMTIAHELGHFFMLRICGFKLQRKMSNEPSLVCCDPEWQAKCFAGELLVPAHLVIKRDMLPNEIAAECGVSEEAAKYQLDKIYDWRSDMLDDTLTKKENADCRDCRSLRSKKTVKHKTQRFRRYL